MREDWQMAIYPWDLIEVEEFWHITTQCARGPCSEIWKFSVAFPMRSSFDEKKVKDERSYSP
jgi:hypothetical protein